MTSEWSKKIIRVNDWKNSMCHVTLADDTKAFCPSHMVPRDMLREYMTTQKENTRRTTNQTGA